MKKKNFLTLMVGFIFFIGNCAVSLAQYSSAQSDEVLINSIPEYNPEKIITAPTSLSSQECVRLVREASFKNDLAKVNELVEQCLALYEQEAKRQEAQLTNFPARGQEDQYQILNDVATFLFTKAEALMNNGKNEEAIALFQKVIDQYKWAQAWDPRGWFWSVSEKSQASIDV